MTASERFHKFIEIRPVVVDDAPDAHNVFLKVTNQQFCIGAYACDTKEDAEWLRDQLCVALERLVTEISLGERQDDRT